MDHLYKRLQPIHGRQVLRLRILGVVQRLRIFLFRRHGLCLRVLESRLLQRHGEAKSKRRGCVRNNVAKKMIDQALRLSLRRSAP